MLLPPGVFSVGGLSPRIGIDTQQHYNLNKNLTYCKIITGNCLMLRKHRFHIKYLRIRFPEFPKVLTP